MESQEDSYSIEIELSDSELAGIIDDIKQDEEVDLIEHENTNWEEIARVIMDENNRVKSRFYWILFFK
jgi:hypothetical protein